MVSNVKSKKKNPINFSKNWLFTAQTESVLFVNVSAPRNSTCGSQSLHHMIYIILWKLLFLSYFASFFTNDYVVCGRLYFKSAFNPISKPPSNWLRNLLAFNTDYKLIYFIKSEIRHYSVNRMLQSFPKNTVSEFVFNNKNVIYLHIIITHLKKNVT